MFEAYRAAMQLSEDLRPTYTAALKMPDLGFGHIIKLAQSLQPDDGLTFTQRAWRQQSMSNTARTRRFAQDFIPDGDKKVLAFPDRSPILTKEGK